MWGETQRFSVAPILVTSSEEDKPQPTPPRPHPSVQRPPQLPLGFRDRCLDGPDTSEREEGGLPPA